MAESSLVWLLELRVCHGHGNALGAIILALERPAHIQLTHVGRLNKDLR